jgi:hypothetical protein
MKDPLLLLLLLLGNGVALERRFATSVLLFGARVSGTHMPDGSMVSGMDKVSASCLARDAGRVQKYDRA